MALIGHSRGHSKAQALALERAARKLLGLSPCAFPDRATGPLSLALFRSIEADRLLHGDEAASRTWARYCVISHAFSLASDPEEYRAASRRAVSDAEDEEVPGTYRYPHSLQLERALSDPVARARCSAAELALLDAHRSQSGALQRGGP